MISGKQLTKYPMLKHAFEYINAHYVLYSNTYDFVIKYFDDAYLSFCEEIIRILAIKCVDDKAFERSIKAFIRYSHDYLILQAKLKKENKYKHDHFFKVNELVYQNQEAMTDYLDGLLLSQLFWPNHYKMGQYLIAHDYITSASSHILEVPTGSGIYTYYLTKYFQFKELTTVDISPFSIEYSKDLLRCSNLNTDKLVFVIDDAYNIGSDKKYDFIVCGELLEHIEKPEDLLKKLKAILNPEGYVFLTTAIYAAALDHIYLFRNVGEVRNTIGMHFKIESEMILPISLEEYRPDMNMVPINYACFLKAIKDETE